MYTLFSKKKPIRHFFSRKEFLTGLLRSDFLYYLPINKKSVVLDIGCGFGTHSFNIASFVGEIHGVDSSNTKIEFCKARKQSGGFTNTHFILSDIKDLTFLPNTFDAILVHGLSHWSSEKTKDLSHLHTLLKQAGTLYFGVESKTSSVYLKKKYGRILNKAGFNKKPNFYITYPNYHIPRFLIPIEDNIALKFILNSMTVYRGTAGVFVRFLTKIPLSLPVIKTFFTSYAVFVKK